MQQPTWKNTLHNTGDVRHNISSLAAVAFALGYEYMLWNDRIYSVYFCHPVVEASDTGVTIDDMPVVTIAENIVVACTGASGEPAMPIYKFNVTEEQIEIGEHYDIAISLAQNDGYEAPFVCFDNNEHSAIISASKLLTNKTD